MTMSLSEFNAAARLREIIRTVAEEVVEDMYPRPRFATVTAVNTTLRTATVVYPDEVTGFTIPYGAIQPSVGSVVRVAGRTGAKVVDEVMTSPATEARIRLSATDAADLTSSLHAFQIGLTTATNLIMDIDEVQARNNGAATTLNLNRSGGSVAVGAGGMSIDTGILTLGSVLGDRIRVYGTTYKFGIESSTLRYDSDGYHRFMVTGTQRARFHAYGLTTYSAYGGWSKLGGVDGNEVGTGSGSWNGVDSPGGYLLLAQTGQGEVYLRSRGAYNVNIGATESNTLVVGNGAVSIYGPVTSSGQVRSSLASHGTSYSTAQGLFGAGGDEGTVAIWATNAASQFRQGANTQTVYFRNYDDSAYSNMNGIFTNFSSRHSKQDIETWPIRPVGQVGAAVNELEFPSALDVATRLRPVKYRWHKKVLLGKAPDPSRMAALERLNGIRKNKGLPKWDEENPDEFIHVCERDVDDCWDDGQGGCVLGRDWDEGSVGFIAQEVGEVIPQAAKLDVKSGEYEGVDAVALVAVAVGAIQEQQAIISSLQERIAALEAAIA